MTHGSRPLALIAAAAFVPGVLLLALMPFHAKVEFTGARGGIDGQCAAPVLSSWGADPGDAIGVWAVTLGQDRMFYVPATDDPPRPGSPAAAGVALPETPCETPARRRLLGAAALALLVFSIATSGRTRSRSAMMTPMRTSA